MALVVLCGHPCSGKTRVVEAIEAELAARMSPAPAPEGPPLPRLPAALRVVRVDEPGLGLGTRDACYQDMPSEKNLRGMLRSAVSREVARDCVVIVDSLNSIKGYRYELWCIARAASVRYCMVYCRAGADTARQWNRERGEAQGHSVSYSEAIMEDLLRRFEEPDAKNRWDSPLFEMRMGPQERAPALPPGHEDPWGDRHPGEREEAAGDEGPGSDGGSQGEAGLAGGFESAGESPGEAAGDEGSATGGGAQGEAAGVVQVAEEGSGPGTGLEELTGQRQSEGLEPANLAQVAAVVSHALGPQWERAGPLTGAARHHQRKALQATIATQQAPVSNTNARHALDRATQEVVSAVMEAQAQAVAEGQIRVVLGASIPPLILERRVGMPELQRHRRNYIKAAGQSSLFGPAAHADHAATKRSFCNYLLQEIV